MYDQNEIKRIFNASKNAFVRFGALNQDDISILGSELDFWMGRQVADWKNYQAQDAKRFPIIEGSSFRQAKIESPRICVHCVSNGLDAFPWYWQSPFISRCPIHSTPLVSACGSCGTTLTWSPNIRAQCQKCGDHWGYGHGPSTIDRAIIA